MLYIGLMKKYFRKKEDVYDAVQEVGFLPFFPCGIPGLSIEEHTPSELWFTDDPGPWEWKGPVLRMGNCVYGKFFNNKAGFVSTKWFNDFANWRRDGYDFDARFNDNLASYDDQYLYNIISSRKSMLSYEAKGLGNYCKNGRKGFDTHITRLQMQCYVVISDFEYRQDKHGSDYGWGVGRYAVPENFLGKRFANHVYTRTPEESRDRILKFLQKEFPETDIRDLRRLLGNNH